MVQKLDLLKESPSQTAGPYVHIGLTPNFAGIAGVYPDDLGARMVDADTKGERITVTGCVLDGADTPLKDVLIEIWQADADGLHPSPMEIRGSADSHFTGWGRCASDQTTGEFCFETIKPGRVPAKDGRLMAPHISFWIVARGINLGLNTRLYFADEPEANAADPILMRLEHQNRIKTLLAEQTAPGAYRFDIRLQGPAETVFFDI
jgi:protocatechuate 3,4-dioxygenase alpha subunit